MTNPTERAERVRTDDDGRDALTQTLARPEFAVRLARRLDSARRNAVTFGMCLVDLDRFKNINLSHGPSRGDDVLRDVAARLVRTIDATADASGAPAVARYDGNAFAVIVETQSTRALAEFADRLRDAIVSAPARDGMRLSVSVGAALARLGESVDDLLVRAEQALFLAKQNGRDRAELAAGPEPKRASAPVLPLRRRA